MRALSYYFENKTYLYIEYFDEYAKNCKSVSIQRYEVVNIAAET